MQKGSSLKTAKALGLLIRSSSEQGPRFGTGEEAETDGEFEADVVCAACRHAALEEE